MPEPTAETAERPPLEVRTVAAFVNLNPADLGLGQTPHVKSLAEQLRDQMDDAHRAGAVPDGPVSITVGMDPAADDPAFDRNVIVFRAEVPMRPATAEDRAWAAEYAENRRLAWEAYDAATAALAAVQDPALAAVITLHRPQPQEYAAHRIVCQGCDGEGFDREPPAWPCTTVETIAAVIGVEVPNAWHLSLTYDRDSGTWQRPA